MSKSRKKKRPLKRVLALPDLEQSKAAVLNSQSFGTLSTTGWASNQTRWADIETDGSNKSPLGD